MEGEGAKSEWSVKRNGIKSLLRLKNILLENPSHTVLRRLGLVVSGSLHLKNMNFGGARNTQMAFLLYSLISVSYVMCLARSFVGFTGIPYLRGTN